MAKTPRSENNVTPPSLPTTTPNYNQATHDFTLQIVVEMQKTLGALDAKVDRLISDTSAIDAKVTSISHRITWVAGSAAAIGAILGIGFAISTSVPWDRMRIDPPPSAAQPSGTTP